MTSRRAQRRRDLGRRGPAGTEPARVDVDQVAGGPELKLRAPAGPTPETCPDWPLWATAADNDHWAGLSRRPAPAGLSVQPPASPHSCYQGALEYTLSNEELHPTLVHGVFISPLDGLPYSHAWVEVSEVVWDPAAGEHYQRADYLAKLQAQPWCTYTAAQARQRARLSGDSGPWEYLDLAIPEIERTINRLIVARPDIAAWIARKRATDPTWAAMHDSLAEHTIEGILHLWLVLLREPWRMR